MARIDIAFERSLALHRAVAERLREHPELLEVARARVSVWKTDGSVHAFYANQWEDLLRGDVDLVIRRIIDTSELAHDLRQVSPFAGVLDPRTRWRILGVAR